MTGGNREPSTAVGWGGSWDVLRLVRAGHSKEYVLDPRPSFSIKNVHTFHAIHTISTLYTILTISTLYTIHTITDLDTFLRGKQVYLRHVLAHTANSPKRFHREQLTKSPVNVSMGDGVPSPLPTYCSVLLRRTV